MITHWLHQFQRQPWWGPAHSLTRNQRNDLKLWSLGQFEGNCGIRHLPGSRFHFVNLGWAQHMITTYHNYFSNELGTGQIWNPLNIKSSNQILWFQNLDHAPVKWSCIADQYHHLQSIASHYFASSRSADAFTSWWSSRDKFRPH